jgi:hypothetical protein
VTTCRARAEPPWLRTNSAFFLSFTDALPVRNFSSMGTASSESLCIRLLMAMSFISSSDCDSTAGRCPDSCRISISRAFASSSHRLFGAVDLSWAMAASASLRRPSRWRA